MSVEENAALAQRFLEAIASGEDMVWDAFVQPDIAIHGVAATLQGAGEAKAFYGRMRAAFPDWQFTTEDVIAAGDKVVLRIIESGTLQGSLMGQPPTGKHFILTAIQIVRFANGHVAEVWGARDTGSMMQQLGLALPTP